MSLKSKVFGFAAATALSLSIVSGAMAADGDVSVTLKDGPNQCTVSALSGTISLGSYAWDANQNAYVLDANSGPSGTITASATHQKKNGTQCNVSASLSNLTGANSTAAILATDVVLNVNQSGSNTALVQSGVEFGVTAAFSQGVDLSSFDPDTYTGTVTLTANAAS